MSELLVKYKAEMARLKPEITARDRKEAGMKFGHNKGTISLYINCDEEKAVSVDVYYDLIPFFRKCIEKRHALLTELA